MVQETRDTAALTRSKDTENEQARGPIYVIDDDVHVRRSLHFILATAGITSWPFASAVDFIDNLAELKPGPVLIDVRLPHISGIELMEMLSARGINWPIIAMTAHANIPIAVRVIKLGAIELLEKPFDAELLVDSAQKAFAQLTGATYAGDIKRRATLLFEALSPRELEVVGTLIGGVSNKAAAYRLSLSVRTIEMHRANALAKLQVKNIAEVVRLVHEAEVDFTAPAHRNVRISSGLKASNVCAKVSFS